MREWIESLPLWWAIAFFTAGAIIRASTTYGIGRAMAAGAEFSRFKRFIDSPVYARAVAFVDRWGPFAVPLAFLTVGVQTAVMLASGIARMKVWKFAISVLVGGFIWGVLYGTVGMAVVWAWLSEPWIVAAVVTGVILLVVLLRVTDAFGFSQRRKKGGLGKEEITQATEQVLHRRHKG